VTSLPEPPYLRGVEVQDEAIRVEREVSTLLGCSSTTLRHRDSGATHWLSDPDRLRLFP
jgi:hypothetical protein